MRSIDLLGVRVDDVTYGEAVTLVERFIQERGPHSIVTPNPEIVMLARRRLDFQAVLNRAALAVPDGIGLLWASCMRGRPLRQHVRGTDLVHVLAERSVGTGWRWYLLGAADGVAARAATSLERRYPGLRIVGAAPGSPSPAHDHEVRSTIRAAGEVEIILVAYGAPFQEFWMDRNLSPLQIPVGIGVGGVLDYLAGRVPRAPRWMRDLELEFLYRLFTQRWRWRRQLALPRFALQAAAEALRARFAGPPDRSI